MIEVKPGSMYFESPPEGYGFAESRHDFSGLVRWATVALSGYWVDYHVPGGVRYEDHHVARLDVRTGIVTVEGRSVTVSCALGLQDDNADDPIRGEVHYSIIADVLEEPLGDLPDVATAGLIEA